MARRAVSAESSPGAVRWAAATFPQRRGGQVLVAAGLRAPVR